MKQFRALLLLGTTLLLAACSATIPINYTPSNLSRGTGQVDVEQFSYEPARQGRVQANEPEERGIGKEYLSQDVATVFTDAVRKELHFSGHTLAGGSATVGGTIDQFSYDWVGFTTIHLDVTVTFTVRRGSQTVYTRKFTSHKEGPKLQGYAPEVMKSAIADCIQQFLVDAHQRHAL